MHSSLLMPWRGVGFGCRMGNEGRPKPLQTRRPRLANAPLAYRRVSGSITFPQTKALTDQKVFLLLPLSLYMDVLYKANLDCENKSVVVRARKQKGKSVYRNHVLLRTELNSLQLFSESRCQSSQGRKGLHIFHPGCWFWGFSPRLARRQATGWHGRYNFQLCPVSKRLRKLVLNVTPIDQFSLIGNITSRNTFQPQQKDEKRAVF